MSPWVVCRTALYGLAALTGSKTGSPLNRSAGTCLVYTQVAGAAGVRASVLTGTVVDAPSAVTAKSTRTAAVTTTENNRRLRMTLPPCSVRNGTSPEAPAGRHPQPPARVWSRFLSGRARTSSRGLSRGHAGKPQGGLCPVPAGTEMASCRWTMPTSRRRSVGSGGLEAVAVPLPTSGPGVAAGAVHQRPQLGDEVLVPPVAAREPLELLDKPCRPLPAEPGGVARSEHGDAAPEVLQLVGCEVILHAR